MNKLQRKKLGNSDLSITQVGFGAWAIGGSGWEFSWGPQDDKESIAAIHRALAKHPDAVLWGMRIGYNAAHALGGGPMRTAP